mmetsp:Transcript_46894/g.73399  ORF Transcript_46894/g.73399 Transcript_46894/m.73399 type:complete len:124 (+) Transcript_46894:520-891(+)
MVVSDLMIELSDVFADMIYKMTKETVRVIIATSFTLVLTQLAGCGAHRQGYSWVVKLFCAILLLVLFVYLSLLRLVDRCYDSDLQHLKPSVGLCRLLPPPPSPPASHNLPAKVGKAVVSSMQW